MDPINLDELFAQHEAALIGDENLDEMVLESELPLV